MQAGRKTATINLSLYPDRCKVILVRRGMSHYDADQAVGKYERIYTLARFRELTHALLVIDEGHFWFPQNQYSKISLEDILTASMSRKRALDLHLISQLDNQVNSNVKSLSTNTWLAHQFRVEPVFSALHIYSWAVRKLGYPQLQRPIAFFYTRMQDAMGATRKRKDGSYSTDDKRIRLLDPAIAKCYNTLEQVNSPILDRMRDEARQEYLMDLIKGRRRPEEVCPSCQGKREVTSIRVISSIPKQLDPKKTFVEEVKSATYDFDLYPYSKRFSQVLTRAGIPFDLLTDTCPLCDGKGYILAGSDHPDYQEAAELAKTLKTHF